MKWLLVLLAVGATGCLVPQEIEEAETRVRTNSPPRIKNRLPENSHITVQQGCGSVTFQLFGIEDADPADTLEVRWFVDYYGDVDPMGVSWSLPAVVGGVRTPPTETFTLLLKNEFLGRTLLVEAVVSDGFDPDPAKLPRNRAVLPDKDFDETIWQVEVTPAAECLK